MEAGSAKPGAGAEPHQLQFWEGQGPVARRKFRPATQILRAGNSAILNRYASPRNGVRGKVTMSTKCSSGAVPGGVLPSFSPWKKKVAARRR